MSVVKKLVGWGANHVIESELGQYSDIVMNSSSLSVEEGQESEANVEGGAAEARKKNPDKYILTANRRIEDETEVQDVLGFTESVGSVAMYPDNGGAGVELLNPSRHVAVKMDTTDGLVAVYTYKTKGATNASGKLTDIVLGADPTNYTYNAVDSTAEGYSNKNPKNEGWYIKNGSEYILSKDIEVQNGMTYYKRSVVEEG